MSPLLLALSAPLALATADYDPAAPDAVFEGEHTFTQDGETKLWSAIERHVDPGTGLFSAEDFNEVTAWPDEAAWAPWIAEAFGTPTPSSGTFLLHVGPSEASATGTPVLFVPGAGDNGSRGFITMATRMDLVGRPVYALTFAHPHGDVFQQAEVVADAIARLKERTGAEQVDVVSHSKGGLATAVYLSNHAAAAWERSDYAAHGTAYRGDVRKAVFIATPLGGIDTAFRWPLANLYNTEADTALSPSSWDTWYYSGSSYYWLYTDLSEQDFQPEGARDLFPGHRQLLARWDAVYALPGETPWLGAYAAQPDWYTTYEGGLGYVSHSEGIDAAISEGDDVLGSLAANGVDPDVRIYLLAGDNPVMPNGTGDYLAETLGETWSEAFQASVDTWADFMADVASNRFEGLGVTEAEVQGLASGDLVVGEISGESDGLVFVQSALMEETLTGRGARVEDSAVVDLSHLDLLYASPITGELLKEVAAEDPEGSAWMDAFGDRYIEADTLGTVQSWLVEDTVDTGSGSDGGGDEGGGGSGEGTGEDGGSGEGEEGGQGAVDPGPYEKGPGGCAGCASAPAPRLSWVGLLALAAVGARRARRGRGDQRTASGSATTGSQPR